MDYAAAFSHTLYNSGATIEHPLMWHYTFSLVALADPNLRPPEPQKREIIPIALPTTQDYALVALRADAVGEAIVTIAQRGDTDQIDCTPTDIVGGRDIALASCKLIMSKMGWILAVSRHDGSKLTVPKMRVMWEPAPWSFRSDFGGTTPLAVDGNPPITGTTRPTDQTSDYITDIDATGRPTSCRIKKSSGNREYDDTSCLVAMGQRYLPAINSAGQPVTTQVQSWVRWRDRELTTPAK
ncbi:MAG: energy transducer TonB [Sphingobium sp.]|nr:energy transducer TonB [Sphingobium sp.]